MSPRLTLNETAALFREYGVAIDQRRIADGIVDGSYPFGRLVGESGHTGRRTFEIWRKDVVAYLTELSGPAAAPAVAAPTPRSFPVAVSAKAAQVTKWAQICSSPHLKEADCAQCPYREIGLCYDALIADAAAVLVDMTLAAVCA